jgi:hypothetical protein
MPRKRRPGIKRSRVRTAAHVELHARLHPVEFALVPQLVEQPAVAGFMDRFSAQVRRLGSRLLRFRAGRKA